MPATLQVHCMDALCWMSADTSGALVNQQSPVSRAAAQTGPTLWKRRQISCLLQWGAGASRPRYQILAPSAVAIFGALDPRWSWCSLRAVMQPPLDTGRVLK